jgi:hypothetical protein
VVHFPIRRCCDDRFDFQIRFDKSAAQTQQVKEATTALRGQS